MGKSSTGKTSGSSPSAGPLAGMSMQDWQMAQPFLKTLMSQGASALQTGGVNAQIPSINASVAASRSASSANMESLKNRLSSSGLLNTSIGQEMIANFAQEQGQETAAIPSRMSDARIASAVGPALGLTNVGISGTEAAAGLTATSTTTTTPSFWDTFMQGTQAGGQVAAGSGGGTP